VAGGFLGVGTVAARGFTRRNENNRATRGSVTASSPLPSLPAVRATSPAKQQNRNNSVLAFLLFSNLFPSSFLFPI